MQAIAPPMKRAMFVAFVQQGVVLTLAGMILDGGQFAQMCAYAFAGFWGGVGVILFRRRATPTPLDVILVRHGYLLVCVMSFFLPQSIWAWRGY